MVHAAEGKEVPDSPFLWRLLTFIMPSSENGAYPVLELWVHVADEAFCSLAMRHFSYNSPLLRLLTVKFAAFLRPALSAASQMRYDCQLMRCTF